MSLFMITNQHQPDDCPELSDELASYYEVKKPTGDMNVYCNCAFGEHLVFFVLEADGPAEALQAIPEGFLRTANMVAEVEEAYSFATDAA